MIRRPSADRPNRQPVIAFVRSRYDRPGWSVPTRSANSATPDNALANPEQLIADLQRQLVECRAELDKAQRRLDERTTERDEALAQQTATAEVLQVINTSPGDLAPVFDAILGRALNLCGAALGYMLSCDGESFHRVASRGSSPALEAALPPPRPTPGSLAERFVWGENIICSTNLVEDNAYRVGAPAARALVDVGGVRSYAAVALRSGARLLGIIAIYRREVHAFSDKQIALLQNFADQAVIAMENARLLGELQQRTRDLEESLKYQTATSDVLQVISRSTFDLDPVLQNLAETAVRICAADCGVINLLHPDGLYRMAAATGASAEYREFMARAAIAPERGSLVGRTALEGRVVHIPDVQTDP